MKLKSIIVDDEIHCTDTLIWQIKKYVKDVEILTVFNNPLQALEFLYKNNIDLIFLDIEMPEMNGFEFLEEIAQKHFDVIFTTAYDEFAFKAFKASAIDYLLKPIDKESIINAVEKVLKKRERKILPEQLDILYNAISFKRKRKERIALPTREGLIFIKIKEILYCISDSNYTEIFLISSKKILVCKTLKDIESLLADDGFLRIHNSHLINLHKIQKYIRGDGGYVIMDDNNSLSVSRKRKELLLHYFDN